MLEFEYNNIIDKWCDRYGIEFNKIQRKTLIVVYENAINMDQFKTLEFNAFTRNLFRQKYYKDKYPGLDIFSTAYSLAGQN